MANLWARGAALQHCFNKETLAIDFLIPVYIGSVAPEEVFNPSCLSAVVGQVKHKSECDAIFPIGPRDPSRPLPCLALIMELGNETNYEETDSKIKSTAAEAVADGKFVELTNNLTMAMGSLKSHKTPTKEQKEAVRTAQLAVNSYNRYIVSIRGASPDVYGILRKAHIENEFSALLKVTMKLPTDQDLAMQYMRPLERLGDRSLHTAWMSEYVAATQADMAVGDEDVNMG